MVKLRGRAGSKQCCTSALYSGKVVPCPVLPLLLSRGVLPTWHMSTAQGDGAQAAPQAEMPMVLQETTLQDRPTWPSAPPLLGSATSAWPSPWRCPSRTPAMPESPRRHALNFSLQAKHSASWSLVLDVAVTTWVHRHTNVPRLICSSCGPSCTLLPPIYGRQPSPVEFFW